MATDYVFAVASCRMMGPDELPYNVQTGQTWGRSDPFVQANPTLFSDEPPSILRTVLVPEAPVLERAVAAPGIFRRGPGRPKKVVEFGPAEAEPIKPPDGASQAW
jgi:hypothetical protein